MEHYNFYFLECVFCVSVDEAAANREIARLAIISTNYGLENSFRCRNMMATFEENKHRKHRIVGSNIASQCHVASLTPRHGAVGPKTFE